MFYHNHSLINKKITLHDCPQTQRHQSSGLKNVMQKEYKNGFAFKDLILKKHFCAKSRKLKVIWNS